MSATARLKIETAWLVELICDGEGSSWLCVDEYRFAWTSNPDVPIRFSRKEDANQVAAYIDNAYGERPKSGKIRVSEHQWG
jgi:hypothetical protein